MADVKVEIRYQREATDHITGCPYTAHLCDSGVLTTDHAASSHGVPVVVIDCDRAPLAEIERMPTGVALGPADLVGTTILDVTQAIERDSDEHLMVLAGITAGYRVAQYCDPADRQP